MKQAALQRYCLAKPGAWADQPWSHEGEPEQVIKVGPKIFAFLGSPDSVGVKCGSGREDADEWLHRYPDDAMPLAYIGRFGWNKLRVDGAISSAEIREAIDASYDQVVAKLPKRLRPSSTDEQAGPAQPTGTAD